MFPLLIATLLFAADPMTSTSAGTPAVASTIRGVTVGDDVVVMREDGAAFAGTVTTVTEETIELDLGGKTGSFPWSSVKKVRPAPHAKQKTRVDAPAAAIANSDVKALATVNPLGFLQFGPTANVEVLVGKSATVHAGVRITSLGLATRVLIDSEIKSGWMAGGGIHYYFDAARRPAGWYVGPGVEIGRGDSTGTTSEVTALGIDFGYRWVTPRRWVFGLGGIAGAFRSEFKYKDGTGGGRIEGALLMGTIAIGRAF